MKLCLCLLFLVAAIAATLPVALCDWTRAYGNPDYAFWGTSAPATVNDVDDSRRLLFQYGFAYKYPRHKYLGYDALRKNNSPCRRRGHSYYDCTKRRKANPYRRGCIAITGCARFTD